MNNLFKFSALASITYLSYRVAKYTIQDRTRETRDCSNLPNELLEVKRETRDWSNLPNELLEVILSKLFAEDRLAFGKVCQSWNFVARSSTYGHSPCLMFYSRRVRHWRFFQYNGFFNKVFPQLDNAKIRWSNYGWLLMSRHDKSLFFFNPFNKQRIRELPEPEHPYSTICFFNEPTSSDCIVVGISNLNYKQVIIGVLRRGEDKWEVQLHEHKVESQLSLCTPVLHCGRLYCLDLKGNCSIFDLNGPSFSWKICHCHLLPYIRRQNQQGFLIKPLEEQVLFGVFVSHDEQRVNVCRADLMGNHVGRWELVKDLGNKGLFVSLTSSFAFSVNGASINMANKIYFTKLHEGSCVYYCLKTRKYHSIDGNFSNSKGIDLQELNYSTWILPSLS